MKDAEPPHRIDEARDDWPVFPYRNAAQQHWYTKGERAEHARAVAVIKAMARVDRNNSPCWCAPHDWWGDNPSTHAPYCLAARAYCEEE